MKNRLIIFSLLVLFHILSSFKTSNDNITFAGQQQIKNPFQDIVGNWNGSFQLLNLNNEQILNDAIVVTIEQQEDILVLAFDHKKLEEKIHALKLFYFSYAKDPDVFYIVEKNNLKMENHADSFIIKKAEKGSLKYDSQHDAISISLHLQFIKTERGKDPILNDYKLKINLTPNK